MTFVRVEPGTFQMGSRAGETEREDEIRHQVTLTQPFYIAQHEVTVGQFRRFVEEMSDRQGRPWLTDAERGVWVREEGEPRLGLRPVTEVGEPQPDVLQGGLRMIADTANAWVEDANWRNPGFRQNDNHPVVYVSRNDAIAFTEWLSEKEGRRYRLPTEAEWEHAARGGTETTYWWGDEPDQTGERLNAADRSWERQSVKLPAIMPMDDGNTFTAPVGSYRANPIELFDMLGNVWEWVADRHAPFGPEPLVDPTGPASGVQYVARGGGFGNTPSRLRSASRFCDPAFFRYPGLGFRVALDVEQ